ncbi:MAG: ElyC/SanA/YdcF family protein [Brooklawnia sp.]|uniref:SanA/YdcF family protein n=1 Tax=Brooklawnia sp. TaxID=2699740 RepID=UPI003C722826
MRIFWRLMLTLLLLATLVVGGPWLLVQLLTVGRTWTSADEAPGRDVVLVMGAATRYGLSPSPYLQARLDLALELWRQGKALVFIVSGSTSDNEPAVMRAYLEQNGVHPADIVEDTGGNDSFSSCVRAGERFGVAELTVVTQSYHVPRTVATCRLVGVDAIGVGDDTRAKDDTWRSYERRELGANIKMVYDVVISREVGQSGYDPAVQEALARHY